MACLLVPDLPAVAEVRAHPELTGLPLAVVSEPGPRATVLSVSPAAARAGVHRGSALAHARSVCAELRVRVASPARERAARDALLDVALSASPRAELATPRAGARAGEAAVHLDVSSRPSTCRSEAGLATALVARAWALALPAVAAVAGSRALAALAARCTAAREGPGATCVIAPGGESAFLAPLAVDFLDLDDAPAELLTRFGIHRLGQLLDLAGGSSWRRVTTRLGLELAEQLARLRGEEGELPIPAPRSGRIEESIDFEASIDNLEPLTFALRGLAARLLTRLAIRHLACSEIEVALVLSDGARDRRRLALAAATGDPHVWLRRIRQALESEPPAAPVEFVALAAEGCPARRDQLDLFRPAGPAPAELDALLAELEALCGPDRVGAPRVADDHRPGAFGLTPFGPSPGASAGEAPRASVAALSVRALRPALPAVVRLRAGRPAWLRSAVANGEVVRCAGPWRTTGGWWSEGQRFAFDAFDVATDDGLLVRLRYDRLRHAWEIDALYD